jgi:2-phosphoglycerate kinase
VCGTACTGKSTIATQLAQRLNLPNVLQTDMVYELLRTSTDAPLTSVPVWARDFNSPEELITEFCRECRVVRKGMQCFMTEKVLCSANVIDILSGQN